MLMIALVLVLTACGGGSDETTPTEPSPPSATGVGNGEGTSPKTAGSPPTFTFERAEGGGQASVLFVRGECPDGSFPTGVKYSGFLAGVVPATDLGGGLYSFGIKLKDGVDPNSSLVLEEIGVESGTEGSC